MPPDSGLAAPLTFPLGGALGIDDLTPAEADAFALLLALWPPGAWHELYDVDDPRSDVRRYFGVLGQAFARYATEPVRRLRSELSPATAVERLPEWETALGLPATRRPPDTVAGRQAAVVSKLRELGSYSLPEIRAIVGPLLGYADPTALVIFETSRSALRTLHEYPNALGVSVPPGGGSVTQRVRVEDDGVVSRGGARVRLETLAASDFNDVQVTLVGPGGASFAWAAAGLFRAGLSNPVLLHAQSFAGTAVLGEWVLTVASVAGSVSVASWHLFVEGARLDASRNDGRGAEQYYWAAYANSTLENVAAPSDRDAALRAIDRIKPAHTRGGLLTTLSPVPGALTPSQFIPRVNP